MSNPKLIVRLQGEHVNIDLMQWPSSVRRDPKFSAQLYFLQVWPIESKSHGVVCSQAVADPNKENAVRIFGFLKRKSSVYDCQQLNASYNRYVIDECNKKLYLVFGKALPPFHIEAKLKVFDLHFDPPDKLGYRRITVEERPNTQFKIDCMDPLASVCNLAFAICPKDGQLFTYHMTVRGQDATVLVPAALETPKEGNKTVVARLSQDSFVTVSANRDLNGRRFIFSRLDHLLALFTPSQDCDGPNSGPVGLVDKPNKYVFVLAYNSEVELVHKLKIDPMDFVNKYFPPGLFAECLANMSDIANKHAMFGMMLDLAGHIYKYVLFPFQKGVILCVKWPKNWYTLDPLPVARLSHIFYLHVLHSEQQAVALGLPSYVVGNELYIKLYLENNKEELHMVNVGPKLKDYRKCANCNKVEDKKRRNKQGQRIAKFKICRKCKSLNFHLFHTDPNLMCHYCSDQCQQLDWNKHKIIHKRQKMDREKSTAPTTCQNVI